MRESSDTIRLTIVPPFHLSILVRLFNFRPREIRPQNLPITLPRAGPADRAPLAHPDRVPGSGAYRHEPVDLSAGAPGHRQLKRRTREHAVGIWAQHPAHIGTRNADVATLEHDPQLADATRSGRASHRDVRDARQSVAGQWHYRRQRSRQYSAQFEAIPFFAPAKARRNVTVVVATASIVGNGSQV